VKTNTSPIKGYLQNILVSRLFKLIGAVAFTGILTSCSAVYIPNNLNAPLLKKRNEGALSINTGTNGTNFQASFAPANHFGIMFNYAWMDMEGDEEDDESQRKSHFGELGIGYFSGDENGVFEIYTGGGIGNISTATNYFPWDDKTVHSDSKYYRLFIQPNVGLRMHLLEVGFALRTSFVNFINIKYENIDRNDISESAMFLEPAFFLRFGSPIIQLQGQIGLSRKLNSTEYFDYDPFFISLGLNLRIGSM
jgi:hypothetical protein